MGLRAFNNTIVFQSVVSWCSCRQASVVIAILRPMCLFLSVCLCCCCFLFCLLLGFCLFCYVCLYVLCWGFVCLFVCLLCFLFVVVVVFLFFVSFFVCGWFLWGLFKLSFLAIPFLKYNTKYITIIGILAWFMAITYMKEGTKCFI